MSIARILLGVLLFTICAMQFELDHYVADVEALLVEVVDGETDEADDAEEDWFFAEESFQFESEVSAQVFLFCEVLLPNSMDSEIQIPPPERCVA